MTYSTSLAGRMLICVTKCRRPTFGIGTSFLRILKLRAFVMTKLGIGSSPLIGLGVNNPPHSTNAYALVGRFAKVFAVTR